MRLLLDTNVLVYATIPADHELVHAARSLIASIGRGDVIATTTHAVIQEFLHVRARTLDRVATGQLARQFVDLLAPLVDTDAAMLERAISEFPARTQLQAFDVVLASTVVERDDLELVTADAALLAQADIPTRSLVEFAPPK